MFDSTGRYDTCGLNIYPQNCTYAARFSGNEWAKRTYAKRNWTVWFTMDAIKLPVAPHDSVIQVDWHTIDTIYASVRTGFANFETQFGSFVLQKQEPQETTGHVSQLFTLVFSEYQNGDTIARAVNSIDSTRCIFNLPFNGIVGIRVNLAAVSTVLVAGFFPNPARDIVQIVSRQNFGNGELQIVDMLGRVRAIFHLGDKWEIRLSSLEKGSYQVCFNRQCLGMFVKM